MQKQKIQFQIVIFLEFCVVFPVVNNRPLWNSIDIYIWIYQGAETSCVCVCTKRVCVKFAEPKVIMKGKLIEVAYTLRTYWNQFSLGGICKQE